MYHRNEIISPVEHGQARLVQPAELERVLQQILALAVAHPGADDDRPELVPQLWSFLHGGENRALALYLLSVVGVSLSFTVVGLGKSLPRGLGPAPGHHVGYQDEVAVVPVGCEGSGLRALESLQVHQYS